MMRGRKTSVTAVRRPNGEIALATKPLSPIFTGRMRKTPLLRGIIVLIEALVLGIQTLLYSANMALEEEEEKVSGGMMWLILAVSMAFAVALFFLVPLFAAKLIYPYTRSPVIFNLIEGVIRLGLFIAYLKVISMLPDIKRVFAYHGAEHKAVNAYEHGVPLDVAAVRAFSTAHTRCGTSFLFVVMIIAIVVFTLVGLQSIWLMVLSRVVLIPVIAALGYEVVYFGARHVKNALIRAVLAPGLWLQALTTREPDDSQLEVALAALKKATEDDQEVAQVSA
ncbi:MAG: DUF1385 domain-containing protein [Chloroflexota bacterium]|nr:DUF1385 domain-containing protein [Chloroflexota bacterium]